MCQDLQDDGKVGFQVSFEFEVISRMALAQISLVHDPVESFLSMD